ncbi:SKI family transcriptional corepressor 2 isoform X2 [Diachasmimorpha longicaudata]|uniref:SKI family transcriptional corepressor 2 isoform X2 n=1 Tax=Diachasmimorpha longicaudata TaxID=58733 RepID=UPI0030B8B11A
MDGAAVLSLPPLGTQKPVQSNPQSQPHAKPNQVGSVALYGIHIVSLVIEGQERLCLAQISNTLLKQFSYNEIHNRRVALGITCVQCTPVQLEILRRAGAMPPSSRRCGMITRREAERLCKSFLSDNAPPRLPEDFAFSVHHECGWGSRGAFLPSRYNSSRAKCIKCAYCGLFFSPNKFIFHSHQTGLGNKYVEPDAANFNSWRRHMKLSGSPPDEVVHAWEDVKAMFNGGTRKRLLANHDSRDSPNVRRGRMSPSTPVPPAITSSISAPPAHPVHPRVPPFPEQPLPLPRSLMMDYLWRQHQQVVAAAKTPGFAFHAYTMPWLKRPVLLSGPLPLPLTGTDATDPLLPPLTPTPLHLSAFRPVIRPSPDVEAAATDEPDGNIDKGEDSDGEVDIETTEDDDQSIRNHVANSISVNQSAKDSSSPQCWSPARETEREAEKLAEESSHIRDVKPEIHQTKISETWHGSAFYRHLNILKGGESTDRPTPDCSACRPNRMFYGQINSPPASTN